MADKDKKTEEEEKVEIKIENEEEFLKILEELYSENGKKVKVKRIGISNKIVNNKWLDYLIMMVINMGLLLALCGWFEVIQTKYFYELLIISFVFSNLDYFIKALIFKLKPEWYIKTLGLLFVLITILVIIGVGVGSYYLFNVNFNTPIIDVASLLLLLIIRSSVTTYIKKMNIRRKTK